MFKTRMLRVIALSVTVAMLAVLMMAFTVSAHAVAYSSQAPALNCSGVPTVKIVTSTTTKKAVYKPKSVAVKVSTTLSLCIKNKTTASQSVTYMGSTLVTINAGQTAGILCNTPNTATFGLTSNPKAVLHLTCTA